MPALDSIHFAQRRTLHTSQCKTALLVCPSWSVISVFRYLLIEHREWIDQEQIHHPFLQA
jgi:hypothetical protein